MKQLVCLLLFWPALISAQCDFSLGPDTALCAGQELILMAPENTVSVEWQDGSTATEYLVSTPGNYSCEITLHGENLIENGDFESGDVLFSSEYVLGTGGSWGILSDAGTYAVSTNPNLTHTNFSSCGDHTSGNGNMMVVNGSTTLNTEVWSQEISIEPNTDYQFSTWIISCVSSNPASLQFSINGENLGAAFSPGSLTCNWQNFAELWNSGASTTATISIVNQNTLEGGNDFALDDIIFYEVCTASDEINVSEVEVEELELGPDTIVCAQSGYLLNAAQAGASYQWQDNSTSASFSVNEDGFYWVEVNVAGCVQQDSIYVGTMDCSVELSMPNVFTPNNDGLNDSFRPAVAEGISGYRLQIFNRWGQLVYKSDFLFYPWKAEDQPDGTYYWIVDYKGIDGGEYQSTGYVTVTR